MSNSRKHKLKGKFNNGLLDKLPIDLENMFDRSNWDVGEFRARKKNKAEKIAEKELKIELNSDDDQIIWDKQEEFCNDYYCTVRDFESDYEEIVKKYVINDR